MWIHFDKIGGEVYICICLDGIDRWRRYHQGIANKEEQPMKIVALIGLMAGSVLCATGCATPGYSMTERGQQIARNWDYEWRQASDDLDHVLLLRPASHLTVWSVE